jgi:LmbE family N-acetylglucosaminyl deacetylase
MKRVLIIAAHPDDDILGCGGIMSRFRNKVEFKVIFIAEGTTCRFNNPTYEPDAEKEITIRNGYAREALRVVGVNEYEFYNLPCGRLDTIPQIEINKIIEKEIYYFKPDTIFTHWHSDSNMDHRKVYDATIIATRPNNIIKQVYTYEVLSSSEWGFKTSFLPNTFFNLSLNDVKNKCKAMQCFRSEQRPWPFPRNKKGITTQLEQRGMQSGTKYAEAFQLIRKTI